MTDGAFNLPRSAHARAAIALLCWAALALAGLSGCEGVPPREGAATRSTAAQPPAAARVPAGAAHFVVDPGASEIRLLVARAGPLASFGHNHVIVAPIHGVLYAGDSAAASGFGLEIRVHEFVVDPPAARGEEGAEYATPIPDAARRGTRDNLLGPDILDAASFPSIRIESVDLAGPRWNPDITARMTLRATTREVDFPSAVVQSGDEITVITNVTLRQSDFGIAPFSVLGGGLKVRDAVRVRARIVAHRAP